MIIDIEGTDGCGKKTQTDLLYNYLVSCGKKCLKLSFPNYESASSAPVKMYLNGELGGVAALDAYQASALFAVDRLITLKQLNLDEYNYVLFDRYVPSNMIHQSTTLKSFSEIDEFLNFVEDFEYNKLKLVRPDVVLFLDMPVKTSLQLLRERGELKNGQKRDILENEEHLTAAYTRAKYVADKYSWQRVDCVDELNNLKTIQQIHAEILTKLALK